MAASQENWIKHRAYQLWEQEGYPSGKDMEHWERAKLEYATLKPTATETDAPKNGASVKAAKPASTKPAKAGAAKTTKTAAPKAAKKTEKKTEKPAAAAKADAKPKVPAAAAAVKPEQTKKRPAKPAAK